MSDLTVEKLADLIKKASEVHHKYEKKELNGEYDKDWAKWYAE